MANTEIQKYADMITLQIATEAFFDGSISSEQILLTLDDGNGVNSRLPEIVYGQFTPNNTLPHRFKVVAHREMTLKTDHPGQADQESGFSATLFYDSHAMEYTFSIRSTEFSREIHDLGDVYADLQILTNGWAFNQIHDMEGFWSYLTGSGVISGQDGITTQSGTLLQNFRTHMNGGGSVNVTGYSLGGNLAQAFTELHASQVQKTYLFNAAGTGSAENGLLSVWNQYLDTYNHPLSAQPYSGSTPLVDLAESIATSERFGNYASLPGHSSFHDSRHLYAMDAIAGEVGQGAVLGARISAGGTTDIWASNGSGDTWFDTIVADSGNRHGAAQPVWHEKQPLSYWGSLGSELYPNANWGTGHSIVLLQDSLSLMALFEQLQPDITVAELGQLFELGSYNHYDSLERILNSLANLMGVEPLAAERMQSADNAFADLTYRNAFHEKLYEVRSSDLFAALADPQNPVAVSIEVTETENLTNRARTDFSAFLALYHLAPFTPVIDGYDSLFALHSFDIGLLTAWQEDAALTVEQIAQGQQHFSDQFLEDRAFMLAAMMPVSASNGNHGNLSEPTMFSDLALNLGFDGDARGYEPLIGDGPPPPPPASYDPDRIRISFGSNDGDTSGSAGLQTSENDDHLYGLGGYDIISGLEGNDYIEGGAGNDDLRGGKHVDTLRGDAGDDHIYGGEGNDYLYGGRDADTFYWNNGDGEDIIADYDDGGDRIQVNGIDLATLNFDQLSPTAPFYADSSHPDLLAHLDGTALTILIGSGAGAGKIRVNQFNPDTVADYGITLESFAAPLLVAADVPVTQVGTGSGQVDWQAWWRENHNQGEVDWANSSLEINVQDVVNFAGATEHPLFSTVRFDGGPLDDQLTGDNLNNLFYGLSGADFIQGLAGIDLLEGWGGSDTISGGAGSDTIYGNTSIDKRQNLNPQDSSQGFLLQHIDEDPGDVNILDGGADQDLIIGGEYTDLMSGGDGNDYLWGGTGDDHISGGRGTDVILGDSSMVYNLTQQGAQAQTAFANGAESIAIYDDRLFGGDAADYIWGELGDDEIHGGEGDDYLFGDRNDDTLFDNAPFLAWGTATPQLDPLWHGNDTLYGGTGTDIVSGQGGNDLLAGGAGDNDQLWGGAGDDAYLVKSGDGLDVIFDGEGRHTLVFEGIDPASIAVKFQGSYAFIGNDEARVRLARSEWENTAIAINARENVIERSRLDTHYFDASGSLILSVAGQRGITEEDRNAIVQVDDTNRSQPILVLGQNAENFNADASTTHASINVTGTGLTFPVHITLTNLTDGIDLSNIDLSLAPDVSVNLTTASAYFPGTGSDDHVIGDDSANDFRGAGGDDTLLGGAGNDRLDGGSGDDILVGGPGDDNLIASPGSDQLSGGTGNDRLGSGVGYTYLFSTGDGNDDILVDNGSSYSKGTLQFAADVDFSAISLSAPGVGVDTVVHYGNGDTVTLDMSSILAPMDNAMLRFALAWEGNPTARPLITQSTVANVLYGSFGSDYIIGGSNAAIILPGYGDDIIETSINGSQVWLNHLYFKDTPGGIGHKEIYMNGNDDRVTTPVHQGISYHITSSDHHNVIEYDWSYDSTAYPYDIQLNGITDTAVFNAHGEDVIVFAEGIEFNDLSFTRVGWGLEMSLGQGAGELRIEQFFRAYDIDISGQQFDIPVLPASAFIPDLLTRDYVLGVMPDTPIASLQFANNAVYDMVTVLSEKLVSENTLEGVTLFGSSRNDTLSGTAGMDDVIQAFNGDDSINDAGGTNVIDAGAGDDDVTATGNNTVYAGPGLDKIDLMGGQSYVEGGAGSDEINISGDSQVFGGGGDDIITLTNGNHHVAGGSGWDEIFITGGENTIDPGTGFDLLVVTGGIHTITFDRSQEETYLLEIQQSDAYVIVEMAPGIQRDDIIVTGWDGGEYGPEISIALADGSSELFSGIGDPDTWQTIDGSAISEIRFDTGLVLSESEIWNLAFPGDINIIHGTEDPETLAGTAAADDIKGFGGSDELRGGAGNDLLTGGAGDDLLLGEAGDDQFFVQGINEGYDRVIGGGGFDTLQGGALNDLFGLTQLSVSDSLDRIDAGGGVFNLILGNENDNTLDFSATEFIDILAVIGGAGDDTILGTRSADRIIGDVGDDTLNGSLGDDIMSGSGGNDTYVFDLNGGHDTIYNYDSNDLAIDELHLAGIAYDSLWFTRQGENLVVDYVGSNDKLTVDDWYLAERATLDAIYAEDYVIERNQVDQLVSAMSLFAIPTGTGAVIPQETLLQLEPTLATVWHAA